MLGKVKMCLLCQYGMAAYIHTYILHYERVIISSEGLEKDQRNTSDGPKRAHMYKFYMLKLAKCHELRVSY